MPDPRAASRPKKFSHLDTIHYEIDMLGFCYEQLCRGSWPNESSYYLCIEGFLHHYRNLCEFFGSKKELKANEPEEWSLGRKLTPEEFASIQNTGLDDKYNSAISRYLSHCTRVRAERDRDWNCIEMFEQMRPCIESFRQIFPRDKNPDAPVQLLGMMHNHSTSSVSHMVIDPKDQS